MPGNKPVFLLKAGLSLILASTSPRRIQLLSSLGIPFTTFSPKAEEPAPIKGEDPGEFSLRCAILKNHACKNADAAILSADTIVSINGQILGKPVDDRQAMEMLSLLNGRTHTVFTSFCLRLPDSTEKKAICQAKVTFANWTKQVLQGYAASGECLDKAGAYAIQGKGVFLVSHIEGSWTTVVGLPMSELIGTMLGLNIILPIDS